MKVLRILVTENTALILLLCAFMGITCGDCPSFVAARKLSLVGDLPGGNVKSYAGYLTVNKKYNSNLFFWFFPALMVCSHFHSMYSLNHIEEKEELRCAFSCMPVFPVSTCDKEMSSI